MNLENLQRRAAIADWRDNAMLETLRQVNACCSDAMAAFEGQLSQAGVIEAIWNPAAFSAPQIDALLHYLVPRAVERLFREAGEALLAIDPQFHSLAVVLGESHASLFPRENRPAALPAIAEPSATAAATASWRDYLPASLQPHARALGDKASDLVSQHSIDLSRMISDKVARYSRLRETARQRIATHWLAEAGEPQPILSQVLTILDGIAHEARMRPA